MRGTRKRLGAPSDSASNLQPPPSLPAAGQHKARCVQPKSLCSLSVQYPSQSSQAPVRVADSGKGLRALKSFLISSALIFPDAGRQASAKQGLSRRRQRCQYQAFVSTSVPSEEAAVRHFQHSANNLSKGSLLLETQGTRCYSNILFTVETLNASSFILLCCSAVTNYSHYRRTAGICSSRELSLKPTEADEKKDFLSVTGFWIRFRET